MNRNYKKEFYQRLGENRKLSERQFLPERLFGVASWMIFNMFYILLFLSFIMAVLTYKIR